MDELYELIREKKNELKNFATDNEIINLLLWLDEVIKDLKTTLSMHNNVKDKYSRLRIM